jgi:hypothetical protein
VSPAHVMVTSTWNHLSGVVVEFAEFKLPPDVTQWFHIQEFCST